MLTQFIRARHTAAFNDRPFLELLENGLKK